jgi:Undecaprenyl-phosphate glucose phosphotransferase
MLSRLPAQHGSDSLTNRSANISADAAPSNLKSSSRLITIFTIYLAIEFLAVAGSAYFSGEFYHHFVLFTSHSDNAYRFAAIIIATLVLITSLGLHDFNGIRRQPRHIFLWKTVGAIFLAFSFLITIIFFTQFAEFYSRATFIFQLFAVIFTVVTTRSLFYSWIKSAIALNRIEARRAVLIGTASNCSAFVDRLEKSGIRIIGSFRMPNCRGMKITCSPNICGLINEIRSLRPDDIVVLSTNQSMPMMFDVTSCLAELPAGIHIVPIESPKSLATSQIVDFGNLKTIQVYRPPLTKVDFFIKRAFDLICATIGLILLMPLFLLVSIAIKLDSPGPIFFRQERHGFNNDKIRVLKLRSMTTMEDGDNFTQATENDPRVTRVGRIIRATNIDELPQLINVILGEMSIVGPRPHATAHNALFNNMIGRFSRRHNVRPGITGWAQVNGYRGATDTFEKMKQRIEYDVYYVDNWSFLFDVKIILMTLFSKRAYTNAY